MQQQEDQQLTFQGLFQIDNNQIKRRIVLTNIDNNDVLHFAQGNQQQGTDHNNNRIPYFHQLFDSYILAMRSDAFPQSNDNLKGIITHLQEHLSRELPDDEWKKRAIKILTTWNLSERTEVEEFNTGLKEFEVQQRNYGLISFGLTVIMLIVISIIK